MRTQNKLQFKTPDPKISEYFIRDQVSGFHLYTRGSGTNPEIVAGRVGNCIDLSPGNQYLEAIDTNDFEVSTGVFTVCAWVNLATPLGVNDTCSLIHKSGPESTNVFGMGRADNNYNNRIYMAIGSTTRFGINPFPSGQWVFVWMRRSGTTLTAGFTVAGETFTLGAYEINAVDAASAGVNERPLWVGSMGYWSAFWNGKIDTMMFCKTALTDAQIKEMYDMTGDDYTTLSWVSNIISWWNFNKLEPVYNDKWNVLNRELSIYKFNEGSGTVAKDSCGVADLASTGTPTWGTGILGGCTVMTTDPQFWSVADSAHFRPDIYDFVYCGWYYLDNSSFQDHHYFMTKGGDISLTNTLGVFVRRNIDQNTVTVMVDGMYMGDNAGRGRTFPANEWVFFWIRRRGGLVTCGWTPASDGKFDRTATHSFVNNGSVGTNAYSFNIGRGGDASFCWIGKIDQCYWAIKGSFSDDELEMLYNKGQGTESLMGLYDTVGAYSLPSNWSLNNRI